MGSVSEHVVRQTHLPVLNIGPRTLEERHGS